MHVDEAMVVCDFCWKYIRNEKVYSPSPEKLVKVVFEMCPDCLVTFGYSYDDFAQTFAIASFLLWQNIPEKILMRDFGQYSETLLKHIRTQDSNDLSNVANKYRQDLIKLKKSAIEVNEAFERYKPRFSLVDALRFVEASDNPFIQYKQYVHKKIKGQALGRRKMKKG